ncbi:MAG TPA: DUF917 domain-containing protein [Gaiellaceae bacterium]|nr:DUF917 domain-containing protein [Gaiellaceae bacterium]
MSWEVAEAQLAPIATGAALLGTGGGGNPYLGLLRMRELLRRGRRVHVVAGDELADDALVVSAGGMGAPTVSWEKLPQGEEEADAVRALEQHLGRRVDAIAPLEMGGSNSLVALAVGAQLGVPVLDGDGMGRAFPELQMVTYLIYGGSPSPAAVADEKRNRTVLADVADVYALERLARAVTIECGGHTGLAMCPMTGAEARSRCVPGTLTLALRIGTAIEEARRRGADPVEAVLEVAGGRRLFRGKIVDVERRLVGGFARGRTTLEGFGPDLGHAVAVDFQNENLIVRRDGEVLAMVPDLVVLCDVDSGEPLTTEVLRYGFRADVLVLPPSSVLTTPEALRFVGPRAFGYELDYRPAWQEQAG